MYMDELIRVRDVSSGIHSVSWSPKRVENKAN